MRRASEKERKYKHLMSPWNWKGKPSQKIKILTSIIWFWFECLHSNLKLIPSLQYVLGYLSWQQMLEWRCGNIDTILFNIACFLGGVHWFIWADNGIYLGWYCFQLQYRETCFKSMYILKFSKQDALFSSSYLSVILDYFIWP